MRQYNAQSGRTRSFLSLAVVLGLACLSIPAMAQQGSADSGTTAASTTTASAAPTRGLTSEQVHGAMNAYRPEVRDCVVGDHLPMELDLSVDIVVGLDGTVQRATIHESNAGDEAVEACILGVIRNIQFPEPSNGRAFAVRYPFVFVTGG